MTTRNVFTAKVKKASVECSDEQIRILKELGFEVIYDDTYTVFDRIPDDYVEVSILARDSEDLFLGEHDTDISEFSKEVAEKVLFTEVRGFYPNADKYGVPEYAVDGNQDLALIDLGFNVPSSGLAFFDFEDMGDDGGEHFRLKGYAPKELVEKLNPLN